ncbi:MAG: hypothetical protein NC078_04695 [Ruminococcus sp.]|nr:hypothetical protein [Ruminococcus sp.]
MSFMAGYIAGLSEGGETHKDEEIKIVSNGIYMPLSSVRYSKITVDVPQNSGENDIVEKVKSLPTLVSWDIGDGFRVEGCISIGCEIPIATIPVVETFDFFNLGSLIYDDNWVVQPNTPVQLTNVNCVGGRGFLRVLKDGTFLFALADTNESNSIFPDSVYYNNYSSKKRNGGTYFGESRIGWLRQEHTVGVTPEVISGTNYTMQWNGSFKRNMYSDVGYDNYKVYEVNNLYYTFQVGFEVLKLSRKLTSEGEYLDDKPFETEVTQSQEKRSHTVNVGVRRGMGSSFGGYDGYLVSNLKGTSLNAAIGGWMVATLRNANNVVNDVYDFKEYMI